MAFDFKVRILHSALTKDFGGSIQTKRRSTPKSAFKVTSEIDFWTVLLKLLEMWVRI